MAEGKKAPVDQEAANGVDPFQVPPYMRQAELEAIRTRRQAVGVADHDVENRLVGLALSGGGIRSATFALGMLQRLARADLLKRFDYLSTVSGGGYIGGSLTWLLSQTPHLGEPTGAGLPYGIDRNRLDGDEPDVLKHIRLHGNYLTPGRGITAMSLAAVVLRGIVLNLLVWLPLAVLVFSGLQFLEDRIVARTGGYGYAAGLAVVGAAFLLTSVIYSVVTRWPPRQAYRWRRGFERGVRWLMWAGLVLAALCSLPLVSRWVGQSGLLGAAGALAGVAGGLASFAGSGAATRGRIPIGVLAPVASVLVVYGLALVAFDVAATDGLYANRWFWGAVALAVGTGLFVNLNYISIHRYYRDRLMEAFMPRRDTDGTTGPAVDADGAKLSDMCVPHAPYHLVNTNVVLVDSDDRRWRKRGGDAFVLSPRYCGSTATGWTATDGYMSRDPLTLPTAVAISGAAANPNTGAGGAGPTRRPMLALLMGMLNIRLGYWVPRPGAARQRVANHFRAAWHELHPRGYAEHGDLLQLSDGGHFENLGVYELVRRRVKVIVCCDAAADPDFDFKDLQVLMRRIGTDFGARIEFDDDNRIERIIPRDPDPEKVRAGDPGTDAYPIGARFAERGYVRGRIVHSDDSSSTLLLLKTTMIPGLDLLLRGYKGANRNFPDQSTADQFFDEEQFEAYRELGYEIAGTVVDDLRGLLENNAPAPRPPAEDEADVATGSPGRSDYGRRPPGRT